MLKYVGFIIGLIIILGTIFSYSSYKVTSNCCSNDRYHGVRLDDFSHSNAGETRLDDFGNNTLANDGLVEHSNVTFAQKDSDENIHNNGTYSSIPQKNSRVINTVNNDTYSEAEPVARDTSLEPRGTNIENKVIINNSVPMTPMRPMPTPQPAPQPVATVSAPPPASQPMTTVSAPPPASPVQNNSVMDKAKDVIRAKNSEVKYVNNDTSSTKIVKKEGVNVGEYSNDYLINNMDVEKIIRMHIPRKGDDIVGKGNKNNIYEIRFYYPNGALKSIVGIYKGEAYGAYEEFYRDGKLKIFGEYKNGKIYGNLMVYNKKKHLVSQVDDTYKSLNGKVAFYLNTGKIKIIEYRDGVAIASKIVPIKH